VNFSCYEALNTFNKLFFYACKMFFNTEPSTPFYSFLTSCSHWSVSNSRVPRVMGPTNFYLKVWLNILIFKMFLGCNNIDQNVVVLFRILCCVHHDTWECCCVHHDIVLRFITHEYIKCSWVYLMCVRWNLCLSGLWGLWDIYAQHFKKQKINETFSYRHCVISNNSTTTVKFRQFHFNM